MPIILKDATCTHGTNVFAIKICKSFWKTFYKQEIIKLLNRNNNGKCQEEIMMYLPCWNIDVMKKMMFCVFLGHKRQKLFWGIRRGPSSNFVVVIFLLTSLRNGYFLRRRLKCYRLLMEEITVLTVFDIRLQASSRISMRNRFLYDGWVYF